MAEKGLGKGLGALLGRDSVQAAAEKRQERTRRAGGGQARPDTDGSTDVSRETSAISISLIEPDAAQPRKSFDEESLAELADSVREHGVLQPIIVRKNGSMYTIVVGERRWRAARMAGLKEIPAIVKDLDDRQKAEIALIENIQREDLSSVEEARAYRSLIDEFGLTQDELAKRVSKNRTTITNSLRLLQLDDDVLELLESGELTAGHARAILPISGKKAQYKAAREIINGDLSVREAEKLAKRYNTVKKEKPAKDDGSRLYTDHLAEELTERIRMKVSIRPRGKSGGSVEISYSSEEELEQIIDLLS